MKTLKFGGTSVGKPERMQHIAGLITQDPDPKIVVLSALSGTTNALVEIGDNLLEKKVEKAGKLIQELYAHYMSFIDHLYSKEKSKESAIKSINEHFDFMNGLLAAFFNNRLNNELLAQGELMSTKIFSLYLEEREINSKLINALDFMYIDEDKEPDIKFINDKLSGILDQNKSIGIFVTQGYICRNHEGEIDNLQRGGSDYTATLIGAATNAPEVQIWTDIDGMHNNDPRIVEKTYAISNLSFNEASELAYFGAKILHPSSIWPAQKYNVPVRLKNTMEPDAYGTFISDIEEEKKIKAVAAKDGITAIKIKSSRMLMAYGFLRKIFQIFENYRTPIDMISTSEVAVSLTIDDPSNLKSIMEELKDFGDIVVDDHQTIICIVGNKIVEKEEILQKVFRAMENVPVRMISYGGSRYNISILVDTKFKNETLRELNKHIFNI
ncbi:MAG: aspartate kinase [Cyclobacteriaceae bacterium]|jgi:aspartate kinase